ncbi:MAG TPA: hypothetical protein VFO11_13265, partial [Candidatus Polarisedimenticolaceae bacterium]|nr:hypothetical protein [Candidatus Polarisedimenticolaceae bacterium]
MASIRLIGAAASLILVTGAHADGPGCPGSIQWDGGAGTTAWTTITNWSSNTMPGPSDDVCIPDLVAGVEVVHSSGTHAIHSLAGPGGLQVSGGTLSFAVDSPGLGQLTLSGGTLSCAGDLPVTNAFSWSGGTMTGSGTTSVPGGSLSGGTKALTGGRALQTSGTATWTGNGLLRLDGGAAVENGGVWDAQGNASVTRLDAASEFHNLPGATFKKTAGGGTTAVSVPLENEGTVSVQNGTLSLAGGSFTTGALQGTAGTTLQFDGGDHTVATGASLAAPTVIVASGSLTLDGSYSADASSFSGGAVTFHPAATLVRLGTLVVAGGAVVDLSSGEAIASPHLSLFAGRLCGTDNLTTAIDWTGGEMTGAGITSGPLYATGAGDKDLTGGRLLRMSGGTWDEGRIRLGGGAAIENSATFKWSFATYCIPRQLILEDLGGAGGFRNLAGGSMRVECGDKTVRVPFTNDGTVTIDYNSTLSLEAGGSATGRFLGGNSTFTRALRFGGGSFTLAPSSVVSVDEVVVAAGDVVEDGAYGAATTAVSGGSFTFHPAATVSFIGGVEISGAGTLIL